MPYQPGEPPGKKGLQEFMTPEEVSDVVAWLAGDGSATISGSADRRRPRHREVLSYSGSTRTGTGLNRMIFAPCEPRNTP